MRDVTKKPCPGRLEAIEGLASGVDTDPGLREHLLVCPGCNAYYREQRRLEELIKETAGALGNPLLHGHPRPRRIRTMRVAAAGTALAAVLVAAISAAIVLGPESKDQPVQETPTMASLGENEGSSTGPEADVETQPAVVVESTPLATTEDEHVVQSFEGGLRLSLSGSGKAIVEKLGQRSYRIRLDDGLLVADVPETTPRMHLTVEADNIRVSVKGTLFAVRARDRLITDVSVERGAVEVLSKLSNESRMVRAGEALSVETLMVKALAEDALPLHASFVIVEPGEKAKIAGEAARTKVASKKKLSAYEQAMALRAGGMYEEAVDAFLDASKSTTGLERERCLYQAASLSLSKLDNPEKAVLLSQSYTAQYPKGFYSEDAYILQARAHMKGKEFEKARAVLMSYIDSYPQGSQQELAHLLLGKIFATTYGNCKAAVPHLEFVVSDNPTGARALQAQKILDYCEKKNP